MIIRRHARCGRQYYNHNTYDKERPRGQLIPHVNEIKVEDMPVMESMEGTAEGLVNQQVTQVTAATIHITCRKPNGASHNQDKPCAKVEIVGELAELMLVTQETHDRH
jgi:hypothetical protein